MYNHLSRNLFPEVFFFPAKDSRAFLSSCFLYVFFASFKQSLHFL